MKKVVRFVLIFLFFFLLLGSVYTFETNNAKGDLEKFVRPNSLDYYPETVLNISLSNLTLENYYGLLVGANQDIPDQRWINFTATSTTANFSIIHFDTQNYLDNNSQEIYFLLIILYDIDSDIDTTVIQLDIITFTLVTIKEQLNPAFLGMLLVVLVITFVVVNIFIVLVKKFF